MNIGKTNSEKLDALDEAYYPSLCKIVSNIREVEFYPNDFYHFLEFVQNYRQKYGTYGSAGIVQLLSDLSWKASNQCECSTALPVYYIEMARVLVHETIEEVISDWYPFSSFVGNEGDWRRVCISLFDKFNINYSGRISIAWSDPLDEDIMDSYIEEHEEIVKYLNENFASQYGVELKTIFA